MKQKGRGSFKGLQTRLSNGDLRHGKNPANGTDGLWNKKAVRVV